VPQDRDAASFESQSFRTQAGVRLIGASHPTVPSRAANRRTSKARHRDKRRDGGLFREAPVSVLTHPIQFARLLLKNIRPEQEGFSLFLPI